MIIVFYNGRPDNKFDDNDDDGCRVEGVGCTHFPRICPSLAPPAIAREEGEMIG